MKWISLLASKSRTTEVNIKLKRKHYDTITINILFESFGTVLTKTLLESFTNVFTYNSSPAAINTITVSLRIKHVTLHMWHYTCVITHYTCVITHYTCSITHYTCVITHHTCVITHIITHHISYQNCPIISSTLHYWYRWKRTCSDSSTRPDVRVVTDVHKAECVAVTHAHADRYM